MSHHLTHGLAMQKCKTAERYPEKHLQSGATLSAASSRIQDCREDLHLQLCHS